MKTKDKKTLEIPAAEPNGFIRTLNKMGYMTSTLDMFSKEFVAFAPKGPGPALDVGAAYGIATIKALENGAAVIANDIDPRHLELLKNSIAVQYQDRLSLLAGTFPEEIDLPKNSLGSILICRVLHFFDGPRIEKAVQAAFDLLLPGGKLFVVAETPYLKNFSEFIPVYEKRKSMGEKWPGFVEDVMAFAPERGKSLPKQMHYLDPEVLSRTLSQAGFTVLKAHMFARPEFPPDLQLDGRESVGVIGVKKR